MNYYEEMLQTINQHLENNKLVIAMEMIKTELNMPYIPNDVEQELLRMLSVVDNETKIQNTSILSLDQIATCLMSNDSDQHLKAIKWLPSLNARNLIEQIQFFLLNDEVFDENKTFLLINLRDQGIDQNFVLKKRSKTYEINPMKMDLDGMDKIIKNVSQIIEEEQSQNPSLIQISTILLMTYVFIKFPEISADSSDVILLAQVIQYRAKKSLDIEQLDQPSKEMLAIIIEMEQMGL